MNNDEIIFECPCGLKLSDAISEHLIREVIRKHDAEHIERVLELKKASPLPSLAPQWGTFGRGVVVNNCGELHAIDVPRDGTVSQ